MAEEKVEVRDINYRQVLPWTELFRSFQVALDLKKLLLAAAGILVMAFGWWLLAVIFNTQSEPKWASPEYQLSNFKASDDPADTAEADKRREERAWKAFRDDRHKWNVLHAAAGTDAKYTDAGDLATNPQEYKEIEEPVSKRIDELKAQGAKKGEVTVNGRNILIVRKADGTLRTWPWFEDRGPNPYLLVTGQTGKPWGDGETFATWLFADESRVLVEPLVKFLYPVVYLLHPKTGPLNRLYFLLVTLWTLATWALFGGAITRMASVQVARNDKIGLGEAIRFVMARYLSFLSAPVFPLLFIAVMVVLLAWVFGLLFMIPILGDIVIAGLGWPLVLLAGLAMAVVLVGLVGWPMMYATISAEGSDSFDAISRSYSYVYQSPWHYIWYSLVALAYGAVVVFFVGFMGSLVVYLGKWGVSQAPFIERADRDPSFLFVWAPDSFGWRTLLLQGAEVKGDPLVKNGAIDPRAYDAYLGTFKWYNWVGTFMVTAWLYLFFLMILGFGYSYFWSASTIIYLFMRRKVDDTDIDEVYLEEDDAEESYSASTTVSAPAPPPAASGSPPLQMVEAPTLRSVSPPTSVTTSPPPRSADDLIRGAEPSAPAPAIKEKEPEPAHTESSTPPASNGGTDGNAPPSSGNP